MKKSYKLLAIGITVLISLNLTGCGIIKYEINKIKGPEKIMTDYLEDKYGGQCTVSNITEESVGSYVPMSSTTYYFADAQFDEDDFTFEVSVDAHFSQFDDNYEDGKYKAENGQKKLKIIVNESK